MLLKQLSSYKNRGRSADVKPTPGRSRFNPLEVPAGPLQTGPFISQVHQAPHAMQGQLFTQDFLTRGVLETPPCEGWGETDFSAFSNALHGLFKGLDGTRAARPFPTACCLAHPRPRLPRWRKPRTTAATAHGLAILEAKRWLEQLPVIAPERFDAPLPATFVQAMRAACILGTFPIVRERDQKVLAATAHGTRFFNCLIS